MEKLSFYEEETNTRLLYANILLELMSEQKQINYTKAVQISYLIQLLAAYYAFLEEIQRRLNLNPQPGMNARQILQMMKEQGVYSAVVENLADLEQSGSSWITEMQNAYRELSSPKSSSSSPNASSQMIIAQESAPMKDLRRGSGESTSKNVDESAEKNESDSDYTEYTYKKYKHWIEELEALCHSTRDLLTES